MTDQQGLSIVIGVGASNGVGGALARRFAKDGPVLLAGRTEAKLRSVAEEIRNSGGAAHIAVCDVTDPAQVERLFEAAIPHGPISAVLYNAGNNAIIPFAEVTAEQFEQFWRVCCLGAFHVAKNAMPLLEAQGNGSLLFTGASASLRGKPNFAHFASAKGALRNLAQSLAREFGPKGIHVAHVIIDGVVDGDIVRTKYEDFLDSMGADGALKPDAIAETFWQLHRQPRSAWTQEIDLRPFKETW